MHFVPLTDAVAVLVLYCTGRFLKKNPNTSRPSEHPGGMIGCKDTRAPMVVTCVCICMYYVCVCM